MKLLKIYDPLICIFVITIASWLTLSLTLTDS